MENTTAETELEKKRQGTRERVRRFRAKQKEQTAADLSQVDCPIEVSKKEAHRILVEERGLKPFNLYIIDTCIMLIKTAASDLRLPFNYHLVKICVQHTGFEAEFKKLLREQFSFTDDQFKFLVHDQLPSIIHASGLSPEAWLQKELQAEKVFPEPQASEPPISAEEKKDVGLLNGELK